MRDVLVALCGLTPQVVTETLWALARRLPPIYPAEVWILTTRTGRTRCLDALIGSNGALAQYVREYRPVPKPICGASRVIVLKGADGKSLDDVRSEPDHHAIGDQMAAFLAGQAARNDVRLHVSVAGGRKTMGLLLAAAMQLYGRPDDSLYHVLVPPEFESLDDFFYPPKHPRRLTLKDGRRISTEQAMIHLAEIPYVRLRGVLPPEHLREGSRFGPLVELAERKLRLWQQPAPVVVTADQSLKIGERRVRLAPAQMTLYRALARTKLHHCVHPDLPACGDCIDCFLPFTKETWAETRALLEERGSGTLLPMVKGPEDAPEQFRSLVSKLNKALDVATHLSGSENPYRVRSGGPKGETVYGLALDKTKIMINEGTAADRG
jgi:CRISPR-associated protein (TIGR02584 family)